MKHKKTVLSIVFFAVLVVACIRPSSTSKRIDPNTPTLGNLNGVPMAIPLKYQFFPVEYEGDDIWNSEWQKKNRGRAHTPDMKIRSFSLLLHLPDYEPFSTKNAGSWRHQSNDIGFNQDWIVVDVKRESDSTQVGQKGWFKKFVERSKKVYSNYPPEHWHYEVADENEHGLTHDILVGRTTPSTFYDQSSNREFYYDAKDWQTKIECGRMIVEPFAVVSCKQIYVISELNSMVEVTYNPKHISEWRVIQKLTYSAIRGFELKN